MLAAYQQCDIFVLPCRAIGGDFEGFGIVLLEAQACGRAVIAGASGGTSEAIRDGETGFLVACDETPALRSAIRDLLGNDVRRREMGQAGRRWVVENFDYERRTSEASRILGLDLRTDA